MRPAMKKTTDRLRDTRGSALVSVFLIIVVLIILGAGILLLSTANTRQAKVDNVYERDYYVADGNAKQAIEYLKAEVLNRYRLIVEDLKNNIQTSNNATSFFSYLDAVTYTPPQPDGAAGGPNTAAVTITETVLSATKHRYAVGSTASDGTTARGVTTSIDIVFVPVKVESPPFSPLGDETVICGGTFNQTGGWSEVDGTARFGAFTARYANSFVLNDMNQSDKSTWIDPDTKSSLNWLMKYPGFTDAVRTPAAQLSLPAIANGASVTNSSFSGPPYNWKVPSTIYLEGQSGASFTVSSFQYNGGQIYCTGGLGLSGGCNLIGTSSNYVNIYCSGNLTLTGIIVKYANIYCGGNLTISGGATYDHVNIYCNGSVTDSCTDRSNMRIYCKSYTMNAGNFFGDNIVYTENYIHLESTVSGLFYSNGNIDLGTGTGLTGGQIAAKGNITLSGSFNFKPDAAMLARLYADPFVTSSPGGTPVFTQPVSTDIFTNTPVFNEQ